MGPPFLAVYLIFRGNFWLSIAVYLLWVCAFVLLCGWLAKEGLVRRKISIFAALVLSVLYGTILYGSLAQ